MTLSSAESAHAGRKIKCPSCQEIVRVPGAEDIQEKPGPAAVTTRKSQKPAPRPVEDEDDFADEHEPRPRRRPARAEADKDTRRARLKALWHALSPGAKVGIIGGGAGLLLLFVLLIIFLATTHWRSESGTIPGDSVH